MRLFTFVLEKAGGTYISQHSARDLRQAIKKFCAYAEIAEIVPLTNEDCKSLAKQEDDPVVLDGLTNAWCTSHLGADDESALLNIILTDTRDITGAME